jgi:hypothetical protein
MQMSAAIFIDSDTISRGVNPECDAIALAAANA